MASAAKDMDLKPLRGQVLGKVRQVLGRRREVGRVVLVYEQ